MGYASQQDLVDRFGAAELVQLTDKVNRPQTTTDPVPVERALADASALIDGYIGKVYSLPLSPVPAILAKVACDIARYYLHGKAADKDGPVERAYEEAVAWLKDVARGLVQMDVAGAEPPQSGGGAARVSGADRVFTRTSLRGA